MDEMDMRELILDFEDAVRREEREEYSPPGESPATREARQKLLDALSIREEMARALEAIDAAKGIRIEGQTLVLFFNDHQAPIAADLAIRAALSKHRDHGSSRGE